MSKGFCYDIQPFFHQFHQFILVCQLHSFVMLHFFCWFESRRVPSGRRGPEAQESLLFSPLLMFCHRTVDEPTSGRGQPLVCILLTQHQTYLCGMTDFRPINRFNAVSPWAWFMVAGKEGRIHTRASSTCGMLASDHITRTIHPLVASLQFTARDTVY